MADVAQLLQSLHAMREPPPPAPILPVLAMTAAGCLAAVAILAAFWMARHRAGVIRRAAETALAASRRLAPSERLMAQATLLRRLVRGLDGDDAATAQGQSWLDRLDRVFATRFFTEGAGRVFGPALYGRGTLDADVEALDRSLAALIVKVRR